MVIQLSDHFDYKRLFRFTLPSVIMMVFTSIYGVVDGFFVSNFVGKTPFAAVNFIMPFLMMLGAVGFMFGTGGGAIISKTLGEGDNEKAKQVFSLFVYVTLILSAVISALGIIFIGPLAATLGAEGELLYNCVIYGRIVLCALPFLMLQFEFQTYFIVAEKPKLGLYMSILAGVTNMVLDALLMAVFEWGVVGAALATAISQFVGGIMPIIYFSRENTSLLRLTRAKFDAKTLLKAITNGSSELMSNVSMSLVSMLYNIQLMKYAGENGIAAYGVLMYVNFVFLSIFIGYSVGVAPVVGFHFGAKNTDELKNLRKKSTNVILVCSVCMLVLSLALARPLSQIFVGYDKALFDLTVRGFTLYSFSFLFAGFAIFGSSFFTALSDGLTSAIISFLRTLVFEISAVLLLPLILGVDGIWLSIVIAEVMAVVVTAIFMVLKRQQYDY